MFIEFSSNLILIIVSLILFLTFASSYLKMVNSSSALDVSILIATS